MSTRRPSRKIKSRRFDRQLVGDLLRVDFHISLAAQYLASVGFGREDSWLPFTLVGDLIYKHAAIDPDKVGMLMDVVGDAITCHRQQYTTPEEFDPEPILDWLVTGDYRQHPFKGKPKGVWRRNWVRGIVD
jgi:hypothetical protein